MLTFKCCKCLEPSERDAVWRFRRCESRQASQSGSHNACSSGPVSVWCVTCFLKSQFCVFCVQPFRALTPSRALPVLTWGGCRRKDWPPIRRGAVFPLVVCSVHSNRTCSSWPWVEDRKQNTQKIRWIQYVSRVPDSRTQSFPRIVWNSSSTRQETDGKMNPRQPLS